MYTLYIYIYITHLYDMRITYQLLSVTQGGNPHNQPAGYFSRLSTTAKVFPALLGGGLKMLWFWARLTYVGSLLSPQTIPTNDIFPLHCCCSAPSGRICHGIPPDPSGGAGCSECILRASHSGMAWGRMSFGDPGKNGKFFSGKNGRLRQWTWEVLGTGFRMWFS